MGYHLRQRGQCEISDEYVLLFRRGRVGPRITEKLENLWAGDLLMGFFSCPKQFQLWMVKDALQCISLPANLTLYGSDYNLYQISWSIYLLIAQSFVNLHKNCSNKIWNLWFSVQERTMANFNCMVTIILELLKTGLVYDHRTNVFDLP